VKQYNNLGLVDFFSECFNGEQRFIILTIDPDILINELDIENLYEIRKMVYMLSKIERLKKNGHLCNYEMG